jgi:hypothetical protein
VIDVSSPGDRAHDSPPRITTNSLAYKAAGSGNWLLIAGRLSDQFGSAMKNKFPRRVPVGCPLGSRHSL